MNYTLLVKSAYALLLTSLLITPVASASNEHHHESHRQHTAHNHGHSILNLVQEGQNVELIFESPAANIVGFEHNPTNQDEKQLINKALVTLKMGERLFVFSPDAQCTQTNIEIESNQTAHLTHDEHEEPAHKTHKDENPSHSDFIVHYQFKCDKPSQLKNLTLGLFELFPLTKEIEAQIVTDKRQFAAELSAQKPSINF